MPSRLRYAVRVLLIAPFAADLEYTRAERSNWLKANNLEVDEVESPVTIVSVTRALQAKPYTGVAVIGHGKPEGFLLDDHELMDYDTLTPCIQGRVEWFYLGICDSEELGRELSARLEVPVLFTVSAVYDRYAYAMGSGLAAALNNGEDFREYAARHTSSAQRGFKLVNPPVAYSPGGGFRAGQEFPSDLFYPTPGAL